MEIPSFNTKKELYSYLKTNKDTLIAKKKSEIKTKTNYGFLGFMDMTTNTVKGVPNMSDNFIYPIISNTNYFDSHKDVHLDGSMTKTAKEQNGKVYYVSDHKLEVDSVIATPKNVEVFIQRIPWKDLGKNYEGTTEALVFKIAKDKIMHPKFLKMVNDGEELQNSIRMIYLKVDIGINSDDDEFKEEFKTYNELYPSIANKEAVDQEGYFWAVRELKLSHEGSAVLFGSNDATPIKNITEAGKSTPETTEPPSGTQNEVEKTYYLINNFKL